MVAAGSAKRADIRKKRLFIPVKPRIYQKKAVLNKI
jgi:hypothetical protein